MMSTEVIEIAGLSVELVRKPIKNLHIGVYPPAGRVRVAAPPAISEDAVRVAVVTRLDWIKKKQREFEGQARQSERRFVSGETHYLFGKPLRLLEKPTTTKSWMILPETSGRLTMVVPEGATADQKARWFAVWSREQLRERAEPRIAKWADRLSLPRPWWGMKQMRTKWGSCNPDKGLVWINLELAKKPLSALDYVILHEIAHFISPRHDAAFVNLLDRNMPGWRQIRADLNALPLPTQLSQQRRASQVGSVNLVGA
ncbi:M48 family metallopeptidase [Pseudogemmobacter blasticus]|uniref:Metal-dependent hydrolase n=1 Tax=Fuscovulum blasticum DSM 2131 TaxID=1188250 RepID=A0A2T4J9D9_FUSBL|nr:SprT family zinc-dependent metalloprotease [Fuscovulum blasticum]PTE14526.1 metal-dependent hydrolase [Fuscovulum blasticum DSM 2131]